MTRWQWFELHVLDELNVGEQFTAEWVGEFLDEDTIAGSSLIQCYVAAQRAPRSRTKYVLHRTGRTRAAWWTLGVRPSDSRDAVGQAMDDVRCKLDDALAPDLRRIGTLNPRARHVIEAQLEPMLDGVTSMIGGILASVGWDGVDEP